MIETLYGSHDNYLENKCNVSYVLWRPIYKFIGSPMLFMVIYILINIILLYITTRYKYPGVPLANMD